MMVPQWLEILETAAASEQLVIATTKYKAAHVRRLPLVSNETQQGTLTVMVANHGCCLQQLSPVSP